MRYHKWFMICWLLSPLFLFAGVERIIPLRNGYWRTIIERPDGKQIIFNFEILDSAGKKILYVLNGDEKLLVDNIKVRKDSVFIQLPFFGSSFRARVHDNGNLSGTWVKNLGNKEQVFPFTAQYNRKDRFTVSEPAKFNINGRWAVQFQNSQGTTPSVGEFWQEQSIVKGTFLTPTGDYRYLQGVLSGDSLKLSGFDGGHAFLFVAIVNDASHISDGVFYSGFSGRETWNAVKDDNAKLPDGYDATHLRKGEHALTFQFKSIEGKMVSINDPFYRNKVVVLQIMGSWCPNCMDETAFLSKYYRNNKNRGVEILALAYERTTDFEKSKTSLQSFRKRLHVLYPILVTGVTVDDPYKTEKTLPQIDEIKGFPTSIFIDKKGNVRKIYTGFEGPGTGVHYVEFQKEFNAIIESLLAE